MPARLPESGEDQGASPLDPDIGAGGELSPLPLRERGRGEGYFTLNATTDWRGRGGSFGRCHHRVRGSARSGAQSFVVIPERRPFAPYPVSLRAPRFLRSRIAARCG